MGIKPFKQPTLPALSRQIASADTVRSSSWYMDSGATHHFTLDITMIQYPSTYQGNEQVIVRNGKKLSNSHVGHAYLPSKH